MSSSERQRSRQRTRNLFVNTIKATLKKPEKLTVSQWAEKYRILDESSNFSGQWSNDITPYLVGIMDAFNDPYIQEINFCKPTQVGGTEAMLNMLGWIIMDSPSPTMIVYPSDDLAKDTSNDRIKPSLTKTPEIKERFYEHSSKELNLKFRGMKIYLRGSGSPGKLASKSIKYLFFDEIDKMYGTKGMGAFTLYPDKAYIEIKGQLFNNTDIPQTFLWWANPAVPVNDNTYSVFPPDVHAVMDHGKRAVSTFPIATGEYYKYDYSAGVDISMYKNIKVPTSYMAAHSDFDFIGNYDEGRKAGLLHVADHHISPGKKQWTWGNADFGRTWDRNLTDEDGPYIELMTGVFADNQPDFTWLKPYEEKTFTQYFMPYKNVGRVKNATKDAMVNFTIEDSTATLLLYTSGSYNGLTLSVEKEGNVLYSKTIDISPLQAFEDTFTTDTSSTAGCTVKVTATDGHTLVTYTGLEEKLEPIPDPAVPLGTPVELKSTEELFLGAQHLEQYRHATYEPADYYEEGLRRDPSDIRLNNGYGMLLMKRGDFAAAKKHFEAAN